MRLARARRRSRSPDRTASAHPARGRTRRACGTSSEPPCKGRCAEQERGARGRRERAMRSRRLEQALTDYVEAAAGYLREEVAGGAEVSFEVGAGSAGTI